MKLQRSAKITSVPSDINKASDTVFTVNVHCVYPRLQHKLSVALQTHQLLALAFRSRLRDQITCRISSACPNSVILVRG